MRRLLIAGLVLMLSASLAVAAIDGVYPYQSKVEWVTAVEADFETENFSDATLNPGISYVSSESGGINTKFGYYHDVLMSQSQNAPMTVWSFTTPIKAFGGTWTLGGPGGSGNYLRVYLNCQVDEDSEDVILENDNYVGYISSGYNIEFWGFTSETPISSICLVGGYASNQQNYKLDDMVYSAYPVE